MKTFTIHHPYYLVRPWVFKCGQGSCDACRLRFFCFTTTREVVLSDAKLGDKIARALSPREARKIFFKEFEGVA